MEFTSDEISCLNSLSDKFVSFEDLSAKTGLNIDSVRRSAMILQEKGLVNVEKKEVSAYKLSKFGSLYLKDKFPEETLQDNLKKEISLTEFKKNLGEKSGFVIGYALKNKLIIVDKEKVKPTDLLKKVDSGKLAVLHKALEDLHKGKQIEKDILDYLLKQQLAEAVFKSNYFVKRNELGEKFSEIKATKTIITLTSDMLKAGDFSNLVFKPYNVTADTEQIFSGKYQPYLRFLSLIKNKLVSMGFEEMPTDLITTEFYNFDVLFQPQNHPARTWTGTYSLKRPNTGELPSKEIVSKIKNAHENGGKTGSKGWRYNWSESVARKLMPCAQGTAFSARKLVEGVESPKRYFAIARCYRPDIIDATHLSEFNQMEGFIVGNDISFKNLLGLLDQFAREVAGAKETRFCPDYYPFTEPSVSLHAKHPKMGWVEFGGAGIFRPEFTETLGVKERVIAWGLGIDRLAMFNLEISDIRDLFSSKLDWLRNKPIVDKI